MLATSTPFQLSPLPEAAAVWEMEASAMVLAPQ